MCGKSVVVAGRGGRKARGVLWWWWRWVGSSVAGLVKEAIKWSGGGGGGRGETRKGGDSLVM